MILGPENTENRHTTARTRKMVKKNEFLTGIPAGKSDPKVEKPVPDIRSTFIEFIKLIDRVLGVIRP